MLKKLLLLLPLALLVIAACRPTLASAPPELNTQEIAPAQAVTPTPTPTPPLKYAEVIGPAPTPSVSRPPGPTFKVFPPPKTDEEAMQQRQERIKELEALGQAPGPGVKSAGPQTKGFTVVVAGKKIKLPDDAYIGAIVSEVVCIPGQPCSKAPLLGIQRNNSYIIVSIPTGRIDKEVIAPGEEGAFDFLKRALQ